MGTYVVNRVWSGLMTLLLVAASVFALQNLLPGDIVARLTVIRATRPPRLRKVRH